MIDYLRLAFGTAVVLAPGAAIAKTLGQRTLAARLAWALAAVFCAWALVFALHAEITTAALILAAIWVGAWGARRRDTGGEPGSGVVEAAANPRPARLLRAGVWAFGVVLGWLLWHVEGVVSGDGPFHEARIRKLVDLGNLHLRTVDEFKDGGLHPGYAFPLWHGFLALVSWVSGLDPGTVYRHEPSLLAPLACVLAFEAGTVVLESAFGGLSVLAATLAVFCFGPGHGGSYANLSLPGTAARQLLIPAALVLFFGWVETRRRLPLAGTGLAFGALMLIHPTYGVFLLLPLAGYVLLRPGEWRCSLAGLAAALVPTGLVLLWLKPIADETLSHDPGPAAAAQAIAQFRSQLVVANLHSYRLAADVPGRSGAVAVGALFLLPLTALARRRRWAAFALGGTLAVLCVMEVPWLFVHLSNAVTLSQARRAAGFAPLPFALAGVLAVAARSWLVLPAALAFGIVLQRLWPGDFDYVLHHGGPAAATWVALAGGVLALAVALLARVPPVRERHAVGAAAMALFTLPVLVHGLWHWSAKTPKDPLALSPALVHELRTEVPKGAIVLAPIQTSYRVVADAPVYVVALPTPHVANTRANDPYGRARAVREWVRTNDPAVARRYGATWAIRGGRLYRLAG